MTRETHLAKYKTLGKNKTKICGLDRVRKWWIRPSNYMEEFCYRWEMSNQATRQLWIILQVQTYSPGVILLEMYAKMGHYGDGKMLLVQGLLIVLRDPNRQPVTQAKLLPVQVFCLLLKLAGGENCKHLPDEAQSLSHISTAAQASGLGKYWIIYRFASSPAPSRIILPYISFALWSRWERWSTLEQGVITLLKSMDRCWFMSSSEFPEHCLGA